MNFKEEYKKEMLNIAPSEEQRERIRDGVMKKLSENISDITPKKKKPLYLKIAAVSGTAICAAAVLIVVFAGLKHGVFVENDNAAGGNFVNNEQSFASPNSPEHNGTAAGGAMPGGTQSPSADGQNPMNSGSGSTGDPENSGILGTVSSPSFSYSSAFSYEQFPSASDGASQSVPFLVFSEDNIACEVTISGETAVYRISDESISGASPEMPAIEVKSNLNTQLSARFDNDIMTVFSEDGTIFGIYVK